ncbi:MAG: Gfo/Idh/MocA family oxidoreductase [Chitinophagaceae bacterium]|nr:Gfo/Idh/MocA family oxidoreductase [Chitinophagaceae bacterium]
MVPNRNNRRAFIRSATQKITLLALGTQVIPALAEELEQPVEELLPPEPVLQEQPLTKEKKVPAKKLGIALVGLGGYAGGQLAPALQETEHCYLAGIVTGTPQKAIDWKAKYNIPDANIYDYSNFDDIKNNKDIDIVYVVLPNALHAEYVVRAAQAGKHVICEKPMAITVEECDKMIAACKEAGKLLSIGYRLHFEPYNQEMMRLGQKKVFGNIKTIEANDGMSEVKGWRLDKKLAGGGPLMDVGIYCVQGCRYTTGMEPIAVVAVEQPKTNPEKFKSVEEALHWPMHLQLFKGYEFAAGQCRKGLVQIVASLSIQRTTGRNERRENGIPICESASQANGRFCSGHHGRPSYACSRRNGKAGRKDPASDLPIHGNEKKSGDQLISYKIEHQA